MSNKIKNMVSVVMSCILSITFVSILDVLFSIHDVSLKLTLVAFLSATGAISFYSAMDKKARIKN